MDESVDRERAINILMQTGNFDRAHAMEEADRCAKETAEIQANMSPPGALGLPDLLEQRRLEEHIPDGAFGTVCVYDRVFVYQTSGWGEKFKGSNLYKPRETKQRERESAPRGVLVSAGLAALDSLRSNGIELGHYVTFVAHSPYRWFYDEKHEDWHLVILGASDVIGSEDLRDELKSGKKTITVNRDEAFHYLTSDGLTWTSKPKNPRSIEE
jgi:hypothetical protein